MNMLIVLKLTWGIILSVNLLRHDVFFSSFEHLHGCKDMVFSSVMDEKKKWKSPFFTLKIFSFHDLIIPYESMCAVMFILIPQNLYITHHTGIHVFLFGNSISR